MRGLGGSGLLLPLAAVAVLAGNMNGLGRGTYDGAFGNAFHMQWVALTLLLFVYDAVIRQRHVTAGVLLGLTAICHPVVAAHGALAVACSVPFWEHRRWRSLLQVAVIAFLVSSPVSIAIVAGLLANSSAGETPAQEIANLCYLFRLPHEYVIGRNALLLYFIYVGMGLAGMSVLAEQSEEPSERSRCGTMAGPDRRSCRHPGSGRVAPRRDVWGNVDPRFPLPFPTAPDTDDAAPVGALQCGIGHGFRTGDSR